MDDRALIQLLGGIAHDLSNVLLAIRVHSSIAGPASTDHPPSAEVLRSATQRLQRLIESVQTLGGSGVATIDLERWFAQTSGLLQKVLPRGAELVADFAPSLPRVRVDQGLLTRASLDELHRLADRQLSAVDAPASSGASGRRRFAIHATASPDARSVELRLVADAEPNTAVSLGVLPAAPPEVPVGQPKRAVVTIASDRSCAVVRFMLVTTLPPGSSVIAAQSPDGAQVWVVEPAAGRLDAARAWRRANADGLLVLIGDPGDDRPSWVNLGAAFVSPSGGIEEIREAVGRGIAGEVSVSAESQGASAIAGGTQGWGVGSGGLST